ncbi:hypothetical protein [Deinococcus roseus]|uniref:Copper amine oxidase-like N-terminal domain-containing protein n=1 Tax=Deinococcus roseus TaxID=392414 RepID=A0ABQ2DD07_9DEIO|nr:hypothetical protein [Deinococcus roseus]GGJ53925.1 hypothetical protein GCM10008938_44930 [Deinococcus roseus]
MKPTFLVAAALLMGSALAANTVKLNINGQVIEAPVVKVNGKDVVQVPLDFLQSAGALFTGGSNQVDALQGCVNQDLFNGVWRLKVGEQHQQTDDDEYWFTEFTVSNGSKYNLFLSQYIDSDKITVVDAAGKISSENYIFEAVKNQVAGPQLPPGGSIKLRLATRLRTITPPLSKILIQIDATRVPNGANIKKLPFVKTPNFRIDMTCKK